MKNTTTKKRKTTTRIIFFSKYCNSVTFAMVTPGTFPFNILTVRAPAAIVKRNFTSVNGGSDRPLEGRRGAPGRSKLLMLICNKSLVHLELTTFG